MSNPTDRTDEYNNRNDLEELLSLLKSYQEEAAQPSTPPGAYDVPGPIQIGGTDFERLLQLAYNLQDRRLPRNYVTTRQVEKWYGDVNGLQAASELSPEELEATCSYLNYNEYEAFDPMTIPTALLVLDVIRLAFGEHFKPMGLGPKEMFEEK